MAPRQIRARCACTTARVGGFAARFSHQVIADNPALVDLARKLHRIEPRFIAYGGDHTVVAATTSTTFTQDYYLSIARIEPENNCHLILAACAVANIPLVFIGNWEASSYGKALKARYLDSRSLTLLDPVYDQGSLAAVRASAVGYIHGHSVGGTNPSLVEALYHTEKILAFDCVFNRATLNDAGSYFGAVDDLIELLRCKGAGLIDATRLAELRDQYRWTQIVNAYLDVCRG